MTAERQAYFYNLFPEIHQIQNQVLKEKVLCIWDNVLDESTWEQVEDVPKNPLSAGPNDTLLRHTQSVVKQCIAVANVVTAVYQQPVDMDTLIACAILHDVCKLREYDQGGISEFGRMIQHGVYSAAKGFEFNLPLHMCHILLTHTKKCSVAPKCIEGIILQYIDYPDSDITYFLAGNPMHIDKK